MTVKASDPSPLVPPYQRDRFEERYHRDPMLRSMVDMLTATILNLELTPTEVREAAMFACIQAEHRRLRHARYIIDAETGREIRGHVRQLEEALDAMAGPEHPDPDGRAQRHRQRQEREVLDAASALAIAGVGPTGD